MVHPEVWDEVPDSQVGKTVVLSNPNESTDSDSKTDITQDNELGVPSLVKGAGWVEVVNTSPEAILLANSAAFTLTLVVVVSSNVRSQVHPPSSELLSKHVSGSSNWSLLGQFGKLVNETANAVGEDLTSLWEENHIALHVASGLVVLAVGDLPGEVWNKKSRVSKPSNSVV